MIFAFWGAELWLPCPMFQNTTYITLSTVYNSSITHQCFNYIHLITMPANYCSYKCVCSRMIITSQIHKAWIICTNLAVSRSHKRRNISWAPSRRTLVHLPLFSSADIADRWKDAQIIKKIRKSRWPQRLLNTEIWKCKVQLVVPTSN
jgi:hypothetical protein